MPSMPNKSKNAERAENKSGQVLFHGAGTLKPSGLQEKFHFDASNLYHIVIFKQMRLGIQRFTIDDRELSALNMSNEITVRPLGNNRDLQTGLTKGRQCFGQFKLFAGIATIEQLNCG